MGTIEINRTTYNVEGLCEPCIEISNGYTMVRISKCYHYIGKDSLYLTEYLDGDFNAREEVDGDFESLTGNDALSLAKKFSVYL